MSSVNMNLTGQQMLDIAYATAAAVKYNNGEYADRLRAIAAAMLKFHEQAETTVTAHIPRTID